MPWFKVDDHFHSHPKILATTPAALGLWVIAGSWAAANPDDGFVPAHVLPRLLPDFEPLAEELVERRLWQRARGGYKFRNWSDFQPTKAEVEQARKKAAERQRNRRARMNAQVKDGEVTAVSQRDSRRDNSVSHATPTRPDPTRTYLESSVGSSPSVPREQDHRDEPRSNAVIPHSFVVAREYLDRVPLADKSRVSGVVQQAIGSGYDERVIRKALRGLAKDSRPVTPDTLRIEIEGRPNLRAVQPSGGIVPPSGGQRGREW